jgi:hypothetical protein
MIGSSRRWLIELTVVRTVAKPNDLIVLPHRDRRGRERKVVPVNRDPYRFWVHVTSLFA